MSTVTPGYLGPFRLLNTIHTGHASQIWQAYDDRKRRRVCIKTLLDRFRRDREQVGYLKREYAIGRELVHPNVIEVENYDVDRGRPYLVMEWFAAPNMKNLIRQGVEPVVTLLEGVIDQAAVGLEVLHKAGYVHRDVKPDNFLVSDAGVVKLIDFALSHRARRGLAKWFVRAPKLQGTRSYMAPEQIRCAAADPRADLYSFACVTFELLSGKPPFTGSTANELLNKHLKSAPPSLEAVDKNLTTEFAQLIRRSMAKRPEDRPRSMTDFLAEFRQIRMWRVAPRPPQAEAASS
ncbi:MAG: serine/threonine-protein kinase [Patescibacteria group bacterium]|nr:serine/threonine-protein kinase [Patescibacteria group bacterium]